MSFERDTQRSSNAVASGANRNVATPGKRTLTEDLAVVTVQRATAPDAQGAPTAQRGASDAPTGAAASGSGERTTEITVPFTAVIHGAADESGTPSKAGPAEAGASGQVSAGAQAGISGHAGAAEAGAAPDAADTAALRISQMGGAPATKGTFDALTPTVSYLPTTSRGGVSLTGEFGKTTGSLSHFSNVVITPASGKFTVTADLKQTVKWDTQASKGPDNQANVASETDPVLTKTNWVRIFSGNRNLIDFRRLGRADLSGSIASG